MEASPEVTGVVQFRLAQAKMAQELLNIINNKVPTKDLPDGQSSESSRGPEDGHPTAPQSSRAEGGTPERQADPTGGTTEPSTEVQAAEGDE